VLSHVSAARFHGMNVAVDRIPHVSTTRSLKSRPGIELHRLRSLDVKDVFHSPLMDVTTIPRTVVDLADVLEWTEYRAAADSLRHLEIESVRSALARAPGRRGAPFVLRLIDADGAHTKSEFERRFRRFVRACQIPLPERTNERVAGHRADCIYDSSRLVIELDGRAYHERRAQMRADRQRDADYQLHFFRILRLVWDDLHVDEAAATAAKIRKFLEGVSRSASH